jgi:hypothetical protein
MKNLILSTVAVFSMAGAAFAQDAVPAPAFNLGGEVSLGFAEDALTGNWAGTMGLDLDVSAGEAVSVELGFDAVDQGALTLDTWTVGTDVNGLGIALGNDNGVMPGAEGEQTLAAPAMTESVQVTVGDAAFALGFTDWTADVTDVSNLQGSYSMGVAGMDVTASGDLNMDTDNIVLGAEVGGWNLGEASIGGAVTYDMDAELFGFETVAEVAGLTAYANGDNEELLQNIGGEYTYMLGGAELSAGGVYNFDVEELTPTVGVSFSF